MQMQTPLETETTHPSSPSYLASIPLQASSTSTSQSQSVSPGSSHDLLDPLIQTYSAQQQANQTHTRQQASPAHLLFKTYPGYTFPFPPQPFPPPAPPIYTSLNDNNPVDISGWNDDIDSASTEAFFTGDDGTGDEGSMYLEHNMPHVFGSNFTNSSHAGLSSINPFANIDTSLYQSATGHNYQQQQQQIPQPRLSPSPHIKKRQHIPPPPNTESTALKGIYSVSGFDLISILSRVVSRKNSIIPLGNVDLSCSITVSDPTKPDNPLVYASDTFSR